MNEHIWGVDLGGTKIEAIVINKSSGEIVSRKRIATEADKGYQHILSRIKLLIDLVSEECKLSPEAIGFSTPGTLDPTLQTMKNCNTVSMNGKHMKKDLEELFKIRIEMANDANCFALAEATQGIVPDVAPEAKVVFGIIMGTGVGGGLVINNQIISGRHGIGGEWGHNTCEENGEDCYCGKKGCNEKVFAGPALEKYYFKISGEKKSLKEIYANYKLKNDPFANKTIERLVSSFGKAISYIINVIDPDVLVFGGGVNNIDEVIPLGKLELEKHIFNNKKVETLFLKPKLGDSAGVFGAAELVR